MAVRCWGCGRLSRNQSVCEWCHEAIPAEGLRRASVAGAGSEEASPVATVSTEQRTSATGVAVEEISRDEAAVAAADVPEEDRAEDAEETADPEAIVLATETRVDQQTRAILLLILLQFGLTLYLGGLSWWSITGVLWLVVGYGVREQYSWALALPLVLFTLDVALLLFGIGPRERAGFYAPASLDFLLILLRLGIWALIWRLRDELA
jgi:hypothetical protein